MNVNQPAIFARITKVDEEKRLVYGRAVEEVVDKSDEIFDYATSKPLFQKWSDEVKADSGGKSVGNLRAMHGKVAAGKLTDIDFNDAEKAIDIVTKVVDDQEWKKTLEGVYTGFSIGGSYVGEKIAEKMDGKEVKRYTARPSEISLVDRPCVPTAKFFDVVKADGTVLQKAFIEHPVEEPKPDAGTVTPPALYKLFLADGTDTAREYPTAGFDPKTETISFVTKGAKPEDKEVIEAVYKVLEVKDDRLIVEKADPSILNEDKEYPVEGTDEQVAELQRVMAEKKLNLGDVLKAVQSIPAEKPAYVKPVPATPEVIKAAAIALAKAAGDDADALEKSDATSKQGVAWKDYIAKAEAVAKVAYIGELRKGMWSCTYLSQCIESLVSLKKSAEYEAYYEGDDSGIPARLGALIAMAGQVLKDMIDEELGEAVAEGEMLALSEKVGELVKYEGEPFAELLKVGRRNSTNDQKRIDTVHKIAVELGATCGDHEKHEHVDTAALTKMVQDEVTKAVEPLAKELTVAKETIAKLEAQPAVPKVRLRAVAKAADVVEDTTPVEEPVVKDAKGEVNEAASLVKSLHAHGGKTFLGG